jgi:glycosyltransferase involved in cell wall biosynthesis
MNPKLWCLAFPRLLSIVRQERPDLIHAHTRVTQVLAWALNGLTGTPYVTTCHGLYRYRIGRRILRCWGKRVMAISGPSMQRLVEQYRLASPHRAVLVCNGIEVDRFLSPAPAEERESFRQAIGLKGRPIVGAVARLSPVKGLDILLRAVPPLLQDFPRLQLLLVGDGPARADLIRLAYELGIAGHVVIAHPMEDARIPLSFMDCFVAPSLQEGFGLALVEAMAAGLPVIASDSGGPAEIIEDRISGLLVPPGDPQALSKAIHGLLIDSKKRTQIAEAGRERARLRFDMKRVVGEVEKVYDGAVTSARERVYR